MAVFFTVVPNWKQSRCPSTGNWINKSMVHSIFVQLHILLHSKKKQTTDTRNNMDGSKNIMLRARSQRQRNTYI